MKLKIRNQTCHLLPQKALFWEEKKTLVVADIHLGKATVFRKAGIPIPEGSMDEDLSKMHALIKEMKAERCIVVGDLIHAKNGLSEQVRNKFKQWLQNIDCEVDLVIGNHDKSLLQSLPEEWSLHVHQEHLLLDPFCFQHVPHSHSDYFVWSGHLHPKIEIYCSNDRLVLPCFQIFSDKGILPAFSSFVGGAWVKKENNSEIFAIADTQVIKI